MQPRVLIANGIMNAGGTESLLMEIFRHTSGKVKYTLLIHHDGEIKKGDYDEELKKLGIPIVYIPSVGSIGIKKYKETFLSLVNRIDKVDILHCHLNALSGIILGAGKKAGIPIRIAHCHANIKFRGSKLNILKEEISLQILRCFVSINATSRWACSHEAWKRLYFPWDKEIIINNMINPERYLPGPDSKNYARNKFGLEGKFVIGAVGRVAPIKNYETIVKVLPHIPHAIFVCFGRFNKDNSYYRSLITLAKKEGVAERVMFLGNSTDIAKDIHLIDLFVMPSLTEGFGMAALEAQAAGLPCIVSSGLPGQLDLGLGNFHFVNPLSPQEWEKTIKSKILNQRDRNKKEEILNAFQRSGFDAGNGVRKIEELYITLVNNHDAKK